jgi:ABC-type polysaccharide/polyol phosphate export permease
VLVVPIRVYKWSINPLTKSNPVYSHIHIIRDSILQNTVHTVSFSAVTDYVDVQWLSLLLRYVKIFQVKGHTLCWTYDKR